MSLSISAENNGETIESIVLEQWQDKNKLSLRKIYLTTMFWQLNYLFPLLVFDEMYWKEIHFDIQLAYMHRNSAGPWGKARPTNIENLEFHKEEAKGQTKSDEEDQAGLRDRLKKWINLLDIRVNGLVNI